MDLSNPTPMILANCQMMINQMLTAGEKPLMFIMSRQTQQLLSDLVPRPKPTWWQRVRGVKPPPPLHVALGGVPIVPNDFMPPGCVHLQAMPRITAGGFTLPSKGFTPHEYVQQAPPAQNQGAVRQESPFWKTEPQLAGKEATPADAAPTLDDLAQTDQKRPSPGDILIKAMADIDRVKHVAVLEIMHNNDVEACTNMDHTTLTGAIQKFAMWAAMNGGD